MTPSAMRGKYQHKPEAETGRQQDETGNAEPTHGFCGSPAETVGNDPGQGRDHNAGEQVYRTHVRPHFALVQPISRTRNGNPRHHAGIDHVAEADTDTEHDERLFKVTPKASGSRRLFGVFRLGRSSAEPWKHHEQ